MFGKMAVKSKKKRKNETFGFELNPELIAEKAKDTHDQTQKILSRPRPFMIRIGESLGTSYAYGTPAMRLLPSDIKAGAEKAGFRPLCFVRSGFLPLLIMSTPFWVGPEGFVRLDANADGNFHMRTLMTDGTDIVVTKHRPRSTNTMFYIPSTGDFRKDYLELLEAVRYRMDATGDTPIHMVDELHVRAVFRAFSHLHRPTWMVTLLLVLDVLFLAAIGLLGYLMTSWFS